MSANLSGEISRINLKIYNIKEKVKKKRKISDLSANNYISYKNKKTDLVDVLKTVMWGMTSREKITIVDVWDVFTIQPAP